jgi:hypothetical protein
MDPVHKMWWAGVVQQAGQSYRSTVRSFRLAPSREEDFVAGFKDGMSAGLEALRKAGYVVIAPDATGQAKLRP